MNILLDSNSPLTTRISNTCDKKVIILGTDGIRGLVGAFPFDHHGIIILAHACAQWALEKYGSQASFLIAHDTRESCAWIKATFLSILLRYNIKIYDAQIFPTPAVAHLIKDTTIYTCGLIISASHNPYYDNGIKLIDAQTGKLSHQDEKRLESLANNIKINNNFTYDRFGTYILASNALKQYQAKIISLCKPSFLNGYKIVLDTANGATYKVAPDIFAQLGAEVITIHNKPNGININQQCGTLHLNSLKEALIAHKADIGFAFDGDGDRVIAINRFGDIKDGDDLLFILTQHPDYQHQNIIVSTIMANQALEIYLANKHKTLIRTSVGDKYIARVLQEQTLPLGAEPSGHIILNNIISTGDGILVALKVLETLIYTHNITMETFEKYQQVSLSISITHKKDLALLSDIINAKKSLFSGKLIVRYSGTEPLLRIMAEDKDFEQASYIVQSLAKELKQNLT